MISTCAGDRCPIARRLAGQAGAAAARERPPAAAGRWSALPSRCHPSHLSLSPSPLINSTLRTGCGPSRRPRSGARTRTRTSEAGPAAGQGRLLWRAGERPSGGVGSRGRSRPLQLHTHLRTLISRCSLAGLTSPSSCRLMSPSLAAWRRGSRRVDEGAAAEARAAALRRLLFACRRRLLHRPADRTLSVLPTMLHSKQPRRPPR